MERTDRETELTYIVDLGRKMLARAEAGDFSRLSEMERERRDRLELFFAQAPLQQEAEMVRKQVDTMLDLDRKLLSLVREQRQELVIDSEQFSQRRRVDKAYSDMADYDNSGI